MGFRSVIGIVIWLLPLAALAQTPKIQLSQEQQMMMQAAQAVMQRQYNQAIQIYSQVITVKPDYTDAYIQRAISYREAGNETGMRMDAKRAIELANVKIQANQGTARDYYQRGMAYRLFKEFAQARNDIVSAMRMPGGSNTWDSDLQAIALEEKMHK